MTFTEEDIGNTGKLKREASREAVKIARRENPTLFDYFEQICDTGGQDPQTVLGDMIVRAIHDDDYADAVFDEVVDLGNLNRDQMRKEDAQMVQELMEALGLKDDGKEDPVEKIIEQRFKAATNGPMGFMGEQQQQGQQPPQQPQSQAQDPEKEQMRQRIRELEQQVGGGGSQAPTGGSVSETPSNEKKDIDELFGEEPEQEESPEPEPEVEEDVGSEPSQSVDELFGDSPDDGDEFTDEPDEDDFIEEETEEVEEIPNDVWGDEDDDKDEPLSSSEATEQ